MGRHRFVTDSRRINRRAVAAIEFAVCLPLLVLLVLGTIEATSRIFLKQTLAVSAYESARTAIRSSSSTSDAIKNGQAILDSRKVKDATIQITPSNIDVERGTLITVQVSAPTVRNSPTFGRFIADQTLTSRVVMLKE